MSNYKRTNKGSKPKEISAASQKQEGTTPEQKVIPGDNFSKEQTILKPSRYIPAAEKRASLAQTNGKCAYPHCTKPAEVLHHRDRFCLSHSHKSIIPLCKLHHELAHNNLIENEMKTPEKWKLKINSSVGSGTDSDTDSSASLDAENSLLMSLSTDTQLPDILFQKYHRAARAA